MKPTLEERLERHFNNQVDLMAVNPPVSPAATRPRRLPIQVSTLRVAMAGMVALFAAAIVGLTSGAPGIVTAAPTDDAATEPGDADNTGASGQGEVTPVLTDISDGAPVLGADGLSLHEETTTATGDGIAHLLINQYEIADDEFENEAQTAASRPSGREPIQTPQSTLHSFEPGSGWKAIEFDRPVTAIDATGDSVYVLGHQGTNDGGTLEVGTSTDRGSTFDWQTVSGHDATVDGFSTLMVLEGQPHLFVQRVPERDYGGLTSAAQSAGHDVDVDHVMTVTNTFVRFVGPEIRDEWSEYVAVPEPEREEAGLTSPNTCYGIESDDPSCVPYVELTFDELGYTPDWLPTNDLFLIDGSELAPVDNPFAEAVIATKLVEGDSLALVGSPVAGGHDGDVAWTTTDRSSWQQETVDGLRRYMPQWTNGSVTLINDNALIEGEDGPVGFVRSVDGGPAEPVDIADIHPEATEPDGEGVQAGSLGALVHSRAVDDDGVLRGSDPRWVSFTADGYTFTPLAVDGLGRQGYGGSLVMPGDGFDVLLFSTCTECFDGEVGEVEARAHLIETK